ncbi:MAG: crosslink repair DNA glycosylase YcaQ family protein [Candidatus Limnocylindrales bacterium]|nr:crosslink repair DNA glycosylase YcaQ family protein [Candidatus Limnocylindrales bacterium]
MASPQQLDRATARRFMAARHLLLPPRALPSEPASVLRVVERLGSLQFDPLDVTGRNHDLVLAARISDYQRAWTDGLLYRDRRLFEAYNKGLSLLPTAELPWYRVTWDQNLDEHGLAAFRDHAPLVDELLERIRRDGPLSATDVEPRAAIDWYWRPTNQVRAILEALAEAGVLGLARRDGNRRVYDLVERLFPANLLADRPPEREQRRHKLLSRYRAHGLLGRSGSAELWYGTAPAGRSAGRPDVPTRGELLAELVEAGRLVPVAIDGIRGERFVLAEELDLLADAARAPESEEDRGRVEAPSDGAPGVAFLAPLDPFVWDREFLRSLYGFDYVWEVYVPAARRRWGYYVLPVLYGDRLVGRIEPRVDRRTGVLRVVGQWWEDGFEPLRVDGFVDALVAALQAHARFNGARRIALPRTAVQRPLAKAVRERLGRRGRLRP